jgi:hypothetical protein
MPSISEVGSVVRASVSDRKGVGEPPGEPAPRLGSLERWRTTCAPSSGQLLADDRRRSQGAARNSQRRDRRQSRVVPITRSRVVAATRRPSSGFGEEVANSSWPNYDCDAPAATIRLSYGMRVRSPTVSSTSWWAARSISVTSPMRDARVALFAEHVADRWCDFPF